MAERQPLFPELREDISSYSPEELTKLIADYESASTMIVEDDQEFLDGLDETEIIAQFEAGVENGKLLAAELKAREGAFEAYQAKKAELADALKAELSAEDEPKPDEEEGGEEAEVTEETPVTAEAETVEEETTEVEETVEEQVPVLAAAPPRFSRTPPPPVKERIVVETVEAKGTALVASAQYKASNPEPLEPSTLASLMREVALDLGPGVHDGKAVIRQKVQPWQIDHMDDGTRVEHGGGTIVWDGPKTKVAGATFDFPSDRTLTGGDDDLDKVRAALPPTVSLLGQPGTMSQEALTASGGICAPSTPFYGQVNFATEAEPVWDSLPVFQAARGGVNVPTSTYIADITTAISSISEANDALGGTYATKSCQDLSCPAYTETFVNIFAHCREYGNLNARTWPEKIAHENALTMAALSRVSETFMLDRIKALSIAVSNGATTLGSLIFVVEAIVEAKFGIMGRFRMPRGSRFKAILPYWFPDMLALDTINTQFDRYKSEESLVAYLRSLGIDPVFYLDSPSTDTTQLPDSAQTAAAIDELPANIQWGIHPDGAFLGIDSGSLELGIVRDSTLNSTNDFQVFGERFRNLVRLAPAQAAFWVTTTYCANGNFPPAGTSIDCPS